MQKLKRSPNRYFGRKIAALRKGETFDRFAGEVGINREVLRRHESGENIPGYATIAKIAAQKKLSADQEFELHSAAQMDRLDFAGCDKVAKTLAGVGLRTMLLATTDDPEAKRVLGVACNKLAKKQGL